MSAADEFTRSNVVYLNAMRHPHKTGSAFEGFQPKPLTLGQVIGRVVVLAVLAGFVAVLVSAVTR